MTEAEKEIEKGFKHVKIREIHHTKLKSYAADKKLYMWEVLDEILTKALRGLLS